MNRSYEEAFALVVQALGDTGTAVLETPDEIRIQTNQGTKLRLRLVVDAEQPKRPSQDQTLLVLRRPKRKTLDDLRARDLSFVALTGAVRLQAPGVLIDRTDLARPVRAASDTRRSAFSDRASLIPRWLLSHRPGKEWTMGALAASTGVPPSVASYAVMDLVTRQLVETETRGKEKWVRLRDPIALIEQWAREYDWRDNPSLSVSAPIGSPKRFLRRFSDLPDIPRIAVTLQAAASLSLPHAPVEHVHIYVGVKNLGALASLTRRLRWPQSPEGSLKLMVPHYKQSVWDGVTERDGVPVVSNVQLLLDLWNYPVRGREQADLILEKQLLEWSDT